MDVETILTIIGLSISIGGLFPVFYLHDKVKKISILFILISLTVIGGVVTYSDFRQASHIGLVSDKIILQVTDHILTFDQLYEVLYYVKRSDLNDAIDQLISLKKLKHKIIELKDDYGVSYRVRGYFI